MSKQSGKYKFYFVRLLIVFKHSVNSERYISIKENVSLIFDIETYVLKSWFADIANIFSIIEKESYVYAISATSD